jgi:uncharacterized membrane protein
LNEVTVSANATDAATTVTPTRVVNMVGQEYTKRRGVGEAWLRLRASGI